MSRLAPLGVGLLVALAAACDSSNVLVVELTANPPLSGVTRLDVTVTAGGSSGSGSTDTGGAVTLDATPRTFGVKLPSERRTGQVLVRVQAVGAAGALGSGEGVVADIAAALDRGDPLRILIGGALPGDGGGGGGGDGGTDGGGADGGGVDAGYSHPDGWLEECRTAITCLDFEERNHPGWQENSNNANINYVETRNNSGFGLRFSPQGAVGMVRASIFRPLDTSNAPDGLYLKFRMRVSMTPGVQNFDMIELHNTPMNTSVFLGVYDMGGSLWGRRTGTFESTWTDRMALDANWHCITWKVLGGAATTSDLWFDGVAQRRSTSRTSSRSTSTRSSSACRRPRAWEQPTTCSSTTSSSPPSPPSRQCY